MCTGCVLVQYLSIYNKTGNTTRSKNDINLKEKIALKKI